MFSRTACILISGRAGVGKSTFAELLRESFFQLDHNLTINKSCFALGIKKAASLYIGWDGKKDEKGRKLLQMLGTEVGRAYNQDCWVSYLIDRHIGNSEIFPLDVLIIDDWRFPNEAEYIRNNQFYKVFTVRMTSSQREKVLNGEAEKHVSETSLTDNDKYDYVIKNDFDIKYLNSEANLIAENIFKKLEF